MELETHSEKNVQERYNQVSELSLLLLKVLRKEISEQDQN